MAGACLLSICLQVSHLSVSYPDRETVPSSPHLPVFSDLSFCLEKGETLWLKGANGCGKTTLLYTLANVIPQHIKATVSGEIILNSRDSRHIPVRYMLPELALSLSNPAWQLFFPTVEEEIAFALQELGTPTQAMAARIRSAIECFGLEELLDCNPAELSYGWQKLVCIAALEVASPGIMLLDEPLSGLSDSLAEAVLDWIKRSVEQGKSFVIAEHDGRIGAVANIVLHLGIS